MAKKKKGQSINISTVVAKTSDVTAEPSALTEPAPSNDADGAPSRSLTGKPCPSTTAGR